jgi:peptide deformylase
MSNCIEIAQLGAAVLRKRAVAVIDFNSQELTQITDDLLYTLANSKGVGLAAPQIGHSIRVIVVASKPTTRYPNAPLMQPLIMINPSFSALSPVQKKDWEGCLSIPGIRALVPRYQEISVTYSDTNGQSCQLALNDFVARIFQHEYDHLEGVVYLDRVENNKDIIAETEFFKLIANKYEA